MKVTQEQCERAVKALHDEGFTASHIQSVPDDHGVWIDMVWNDDMKDAYNFRIHPEEIIFWESHLENKNTQAGIADAEQLEESLRSDMFTDSEKFTA